MYIENLVLEIIEVMEQIQSFYNETKTIIVE